MPCEAVVFETLIVGQGAMHHLVRGLDWSQTPLGALDTWSEVLVSQVNFLLSSETASTLSWGDELTFIYNDAAIPTLGLKHPAALGKPGMAVFPEAWHMMGPEMDACYLRGETLFRKQVCFPLLMRGEVEDAYFNYSLTPVYERGHIAGVHGLHENITESMSYRRERDSVTLQLAQVLEATSDGVVSLDREWKISYLNARAHAILRMDDSLLGRNTWETFPHQIYPNSPYVKYYEQAMYQGIEGMFEAFYPEPLNLYMKIEVRPARDGIVVFIHDVTERVQVEQQLEQSKAREREAESRERNNLRELFEYAPAFIALLTGPEHVFEMANTAYQQMMGGRILIGCKVVDCVPEVRGTAWIPTLDAVYRTGIPHVESGARLMLAATPGGPLEERIVDYVYQPRRRPDGTIFGLIALGTDVTDQRRAEQALIQSEKLAVVGRLASSIAHEINNPLGAAMNYLYLAGVSDDVAEVRDFIRSAEGELRRVSIISTQTLLSQKQFFRPSSTNLQEITGGVLLLYQGRIKTAHVQVEVRHHAPHPVVCIEGEIRQTFANLIGNAIDAMNPDGGRLLLRSHPATDWKTGRKGSRMTFADTGPGIDPSVQERIFDPFFTTKGALGNGLGLWITQEIITRHHGKIRMRSVAGKPRSGTVITLFLPDAP
jgi:signal transduction histidine kinase